MPLLGRDKGRSRSRRSDDEFVVFLQGIPSHCRWQELKDLVRQTALHIRQAVVYDDSHGFPTGIGQIIVKNEDEAWRTYHRLSTNGWEGQSLVVTLSRTSTPTKPIAGPTRSPAMIQGYISGLSTPPRAHGNMAMPPSPVSPESHPQTPTFQYPDYNIMPLPLQMQQFIPMHPDLSQLPLQCYPTSPLLANPYDQHWVYATQTDPHPKQPNPHSPPFTPDHRALTLDNLSTATTTTDIKNLLSAAGTIASCKIFSEGAQTRAKVSMASGEEARRAASMFHNLFFGGSRIRVRVEDAVGGFDSASASEVSVSDEELGSWADEMSGFESEKVPCKPLVVDGSGLNRHDGICAAPT